MLNDKHSIEFQLLDFMVDGASSFAGLYHDLTVRAGYPREIDVRCLLGVLREMENSGLVSTSSEDNRQHNVLSTMNVFEWEEMIKEYSQWFSVADTNELSYDEIGLWIQITQDGRESWRQWAESIGRNPVLGE